MTEMLTRNEAEEVRMPNTPEVQELARIANAERDLMIARKLVESRAELLSHVPREIQIQAGELIGKVSKVN